MIRIVRSAVVATVLAAGSVVALPAAAHAAPGTNECQYNLSYSGVAASGLCGRRTDGNNQFRIRIRCADGIVRYGRWQYTGSGNYSSASCDRAVRVTAVGFDFRRVVNV